MERQEIEDLIVKAVQSGKKETSDLVDMILHKIEPMIEKATAIGIEKNVNGRIRELTRITNEHNELVNLHFEQDRIWKEKNDPYLESLANITGAGKIIVWLAAGLGTVIGVIVIIKEKLLR